MSAPPLSLPLFLIAASLVVPGALLFLGIRWLWRKWRARKFNWVELRCADEQAKFLPRNPSRDEAKRDLRAAELRERVAEDERDAEAALAALAESGPRLSMRDVMRDLGIEPTHVHSGDPAHVDRDFRAWECERCTQMRAARYTGGAIWQVMEPSHISTTGGYVPTTTTATDTPPLSFTASNGTTSTTLTWNGPAPVERKRIHPLGWACVYVANYSDHAGGWLCAVPPNGPAVHCFSEIREAWEPAPDWLADAARRVLGEST